MTYEVRDSQRHCKLSCRPIDRLLTGRGRQRAGEVLDVIPRVVGEELAGWDAAVAGALREQMAGCDSRPVVDATDRPVRLLRPTIPAHDDIKPKRGAKEGSLRTGCTPSSCSGVSMSSFPLLTAVPIMAAIIVLPALSVSQVVSARTPSAYHSWTSAPSFATSTLQRCGTASCQDHPKRSQEK
eukprot:COSAG01_NODE_9628_length_2385_cov_1.463255_4_plen_183_part_00